MTWYLAVLPYFKAYFVLLLIGPGPLVENQAVFFSVFAKEVYISWRKLVSISIHLNDSWHRTLRKLCHLKSLLIDVQFEVSDPIT